MKNIVLLLLFVLMHFVSSAKDTRFTIKVDNPNARLAIVVKNKAYPIKVDQTGYGEQIIPLEKGEFAQIKYGRRSFDCFLSVGKELNVIWKSVKDFKYFDMKCEDGGITAYLMERMRGKRSWNEGTTKEDEFLANFDAKVIGQIESLKIHRFPAEFTSLEIERIRYAAAGKLLNYPLRHKAYQQENKGYQPSGAYYNKLKTLLVEKPELYAFAVYKRFISRALHVIVKNENKNMDMISLTEKCIKMLTERFKDPKIKEYLVKEYALSAVSSKGAQGAEEIVRLFNLYVTDKSALDKMNSIIKKWQTIAIGQASPTFNYEDINGNMVSLASLKGKYVYIDCWATWCGPCRGEIPHLQKLEHDYANKNIHFVSISSDKKKEAWTKMVKKDKLGGIQLFRGDDRSFSKAFMITGIPRFILLDKEGRIVNSKAPRPSQKETRDLFDSLEGI